ncbi:hypothetical protein ABIC47_003471 [Leifsonia sp. 563]
MHLAQVVSPAERGRPLGRRWLLGVIADDPGTARTGMASGGVHVYDLVDDFPGRGIVCCDGNKLGCGAVEYVAERRKQGE